MTGALVIDITKKQRSLLGGEVLQFWCVVVAPREKYPISGVRRGLKGVLGVYCCVGTVVGGWCQAEEKRNKYPISGVRRGLKGVLRGE